MTVHTLRPMTEYMTFMREGSIGKVIRPAGRTIPSVMAPEVLRVIEIDGKFHVGRIVEQHGAYVLHSVAAFDDLGAAEMCFYAEAGR